jgi:hypothetical protein
MQDLDIINRALSNTGNLTLTEQNDGSDEGQAAEIAFQRAKEYLVSVYEWPWHTLTKAPTRIGASDMPPYVHALQYPPDCWHLRSVIDEAYGVPQQHRLQGGKIHTFSDTGILLFYVTTPFFSSAWHPLATEALTIFTEAYLWRGLNDDAGSADKRMQDAENMLARAAGRAGQQDSPRFIYRSRAGTARRSRKI